MVGGLSPPWLSAGWASPQHVKSASSGRLLLPPAENGLQILKVTLPVASRCCRTLTLSAWLRVCLRASAAAGCIALLSGCVTLPHIGKPSPVVQTSTTPICPGGLRVALEPQPPVPDDAGFPAAQTDAESAQVASYLTWLSDLARWGRTGWARAADAKTWCETKR